MARIDEREVFARYIGEKINAIRHSEYNKSAFFETYTDYCRIYGNEIPELPRRFALHSARIRLVQPVTGAIIDIESQLPDEMKRLMDI